MGYGCVGVGEYFYFGVVELYVVVDYGWVVEHIAVGELVHWLVVLVVFDFGYFGV